MMDKYLKIFELDNTATIEDLELRYQQLLKEFTTKNIDQDLKQIKDIINTFYQ